MRRPLSKYRPAGPFIAKPFRIGLLNKDKETTEVENNRQVAETTKTENEVREHSYTYRFNPNGGEGPINTPEVLDFIEFQTGQVTGTPSDKLNVRLKFDYMDNLGISRTKEVQMGEDSSHRVHAGIFGNSWVDIYNTGGSIEVLDDEGGFTKTTIVLARYQ